MKVNKYLHFVMLLAILLNAFSFLESGTGQGNRNLLLAFGNFECFPTISNNTLQVIDCLFPHDLKETKKIVTFLSYNYCTHKLGA